MEEVEVEVGGGRNARGRKGSLALAVGGVIEKGFDSPCAPPMKITTLSYGHRTIFTLKVG